MSNLQRLRENIAAIECALKGESDAQVINKFTGFGGLGFVLNPIEDKKAWSKTDLVCYEDTVRLVELLREQAGSEKMFKKWMQSLKASTLTAFYTPEEFVAAIFKAIVNHAISNEIFGRYYRSFLDPAAGMGVFAKRFLWSAHGYGQKQVTCFEKDILRS